MNLSGKNKKVLIISGVVISSIVLLIVVAQLILGSIVTSKIHDAINSNKNEKYNVEIRKAKVNLFTMSLILKDVVVDPDTSLISSLKNGNVKVPVIKLRIPVFRIRNVGVFDILSRKEINVGELILRNSNIDILLPERKKEEQDESSEKPTRFNTDSLTIAGISGGLINYIGFKNINLNLINAKSGDTILSSKDLDIELDEIVLEMNSDSTFRLRLEQFEFELSDEKFNLPGNKYMLSFSRLNINKKEKKIEVKDLLLEPRYSRAKMASFSDYQYEIYSLKIAKTEINSISIGKIARDSGIYIPEINIDRMNLDIYKDKAKPFDENKRPLLPQQLLRHMKVNLFIDSINISNSELVYSEKHDLVKELMKVDLADLNVGIRNVTSISDSIIAGTAMTVKLRANIQKVIPMGVDMYFPMKSVSDTFFFSGFMESGKMKNFNNILLPALGITFENGVLDKLEFKASANPDWAIGSMTMQYHDLEGNIRRQDMENKNRFLSWAANQIIISNNPVNNNPVRTVPMYFERVPYKGIGNYLWKTVQSGIMATVIPTVSNRVQNEIYEKLGTSKADIKKNERAKRKVEKEHNRKLKKDN